MGYIELPRLYYIDKEKYASEYQSRFNSPDAIKLDQKIKGNPAFFVQTSEVSNLVFQILRTDKIISILSGELPEAALDQFAKRCLIDEIVLTNKIEGVYSTRREIALILNDLEDKISGSKKRKRFWGLVNQYYKLKSKEHVTLKTCTEVRRLYDELVLSEVIEENPGNAPDGTLFRKDSTSVYSSSDKEIHRGVYPETAIIGELEKALLFLHDESIEQLFRVSVFHYLFEYIHPFYDGNGRFGRFVVSNLLSQELNPLLAYRISYTITANINLYYDTFKVCNDTNNLGDLTPFLIMMLNMIKTSIHQLEEALRNRSTRLARYKERIYHLKDVKRPRTYDAWFILVQAGLFSEYGISTKEFSNYLRCSYSTAKTELDSIDNKSLLVKSRIGRENFYMLDLERLDVMLHGS